MFLVGLEFDLELIRKRVRSAVAVSWAGIATPFVLGALLAYVLARPLPALRPERRALGGGALHGRGDVDHRLPDAGAHHLRARARRAPRSARSRSPPARSTTRRPGACWRSCSRASPAKIVDRGARASAAARSTRSSCSPSAAGCWRGSSPGSRRSRRGRGLVLPADARSCSRSPPGSPTRSASTPSSAPSCSAPRCRAGALQKRLEGQIAPLTTTYLLPMFFINSGLNTRDRPARLVAAMLGRRAARARRGDRSARGSPAASRRASPASRSATRWRSAR